MDTKAAAGLIIYRMQKTPEFLLVNDTFAGRRHWTPPKGSGATAPTRRAQRGRSVALTSNRGCGRAIAGPRYILPGEDSLKAALREARELTGLPQRDLRVESTFIKTIRYVRSVCILAVRATPLGWAARLTSRLRTASPPPVCPPSPSSPVRLLPREACAPPPPVATCRNPSPRR